MPLVDREPIPLNSVPEWVENTQLYSILFLEVVSRPAQVIYRKLHFFMLINKMSLNTTGTK
jgi:hypothetical protein